MASVKEFRVPSQSGISDIYVRAWLPESAPKAVFQINHGMAEHSLRYNEFAESLTGRGFAVVCHDHIGHGKSVKTDDDLGWFGEKNGWRNFALDSRRVTELIKAEFPGLPIIFFGHSMGSFVARDYASLYGNDEDIKGFIFCGTAGANPAAAAGILMANAIAKIKGNHYRSKFIDSVAFGAYNKKYENPRTNFDWLTRDEEIVDTYIADRYSGFLFTAYGYRDMFTLLKSVTALTWYKELNPDKPVLLVCGEMDPVGNYGKGVTETFNGIKAAGVKDVSIKIYENCRHEILNELNRADVYADLAAWSESKLN